MASPLGTPPRRLLVLSLLAVVVGLLGGVVGWAFLRITALLLNLTLAHRVAWTFPQLANVHPGWTLIPIAVAGGVLVSLIAKREPMVRGHGIPEAMDSVLRHQSRISGRAAIAKPVATSAAIGTGAPFGAEGPIIVTGGALGSLLGQTLKVSPAERKILLAAGAAAGMAAIFGTPVGAVLLAIELLLFEFSTRAFVPLVVASVVADAVHTSFFGPGPFFAVPAFNSPGAGQLPFYAILGVLTGLLGVVITAGLYKIDDGFARFPRSSFWHPVIGALAFALIGIAVPRALGPGYDVITGTLNARLAAGTVALVLVAKLVAWWITMGSGSSGSSLAPLLLIGAAAGYLAGSGLEHLAPGVGLSPAAFALVGMVATFGAAADAPFTSIVLGFELTRNYNLILPLMLAVVVADLLARSLQHESLMTQKLARRGVRVSTDYQVDLLRTSLVADVMTTDVQTLDDSATIGQALEHFQDGHHHSAYPIIDPDGRCVGILTQRDLLRHDLQPQAPAMSIASVDLVTAQPVDSTLDALIRMVHDGVNQLPVVDDEHLVGLCTRVDILRLSDVQAEHERAQPGWFTRHRRRLR